MSESDSQLERTAFAGIADQEGQGEQKDQEPYFDYGEQQHWDDLHIRRVNRILNPVRRFRNEKDFKSTTTFLGQLGEFGHK